MKKLIAIALFVSAAIGFTACSSNDDGPIKVDRDYTGTWESDKLTYNLNGTNMSHNYIEMRGADAVTKNDELVLTKSKAVLTEYFVNKGGEPVVTYGTVKDTIITFDNPKYKTRIIKGIVKGQLSLEYAYTYGTETLPVTVTYTKR